MISYMCNTARISQQNGDMGSGMGIGARAIAARSQDSALLWALMINEYTKRTLTFSRDKLPALSSLAAYFWMCTNDTYLAGLWKSHLPGGLLWYVHSPKLTKKPLKYRAPSWSFASLDGEIIFTLLEYKFHRFQAETVAEVTKAVVEKDKDSTEFGQITGGYIELRSSLYYLADRYRELVMWQMPTPNGRLCLSMAGVLGFFPDEHSNDKASHLWFVVIEKRQVAPNVSIPLGLVLTFKNIGFVRIGMGILFPWPSLKPIETTVKIY
jgi:hypothetical protein